MSLTSSLTIWKFPVSPQFKLSLPRGARVLDVQLQNGEPQMWVLLNPDDPRIERQFFALGTGHTIKGPSYDDLRYCGTFQRKALVFHVFESKP